MDFGIKGKTALVAAASKGLGFGCAERLAAEGCRVAVCARHTGDAERAARKIGMKTGADIMGFGADVSTHEDIQTLLALVNESIGEPDILVTNAGGPPPGTFTSTPIDAYQGALQLNLMSAVHLIHGVARGMQSRRWGRIIAITSISVKQPIENLLLSNMARAGLTGFLKTIATELAPFGITVNALLPGIHKTSRVDQLAQDKATRENKPVELVYEEMTADIPIGIMGNSYDFGAVAAFLASSQAQYITGQNILVDGGAYRGLL